MTEAAKFFSTLVVRKLTAIGNQVDRDPAKRNTVRRYRATSDQYEQALKTLAQSEQLNAQDKNIGETVPSDIAFQVMAHQQLDHKEEL